MDITDKTYISTVWFFHFRGDSASPEGDFLAFVYQDEENLVGEWKIEYRFRYYTGDKAAGPWNNDRKSVFGGSLGRQLDLDKLRMLICRFTNIAPGGCDRCDELRIDGGSKALHEVMSRMPWAHIKELSPAVSA